MKRRLEQVCGIVAALVVLLDQVVKALVDRLMSLHESRVVVDGFICLTYVHNRGGAFGFLSDSDFPYQPLLFTLVSLSALVAIAVYGMRLPEASVLPRLALALIIGGAIGNLLDRVFLSYVRDFVDVFWGPHHWPAFNLADSAISVGVGLLVLDMLRSPQAPDRDEGVAAPSAGRGE